MIDDLYNNDVVVNRIIVDFSLSGLDVSITILEAESNNF